MWPLKKIKKTYLITKPINEVYDQLKNITEDDFKDRAFIKGRLLNIEPILFEFFIASYKQIRPFRTDLLVTLIEENGDTRINAVTKSNATFPILMFILIPQFIGYMFINNTWLDIKTWLIYIAGFSIAYFGDWISKNVVLVTFESYIPKTR